MNNCKSKISITANWRSKKNITTSTDFEMCSSSSPFGNMFFFYFRALAFRKKISAPKTIAINRQRLWWPADNRVFSRSQELLAQTEKSGELKLTFIGPVAQPDFSNICRSMHE